jgi:transposase-like protein
MALTEEQRAMLQLLLEGGQSYSDIGSLLGIGPDEVRSRARDALREMGGEDPDSQVQLSDYLLGQADPIGRADAVRVLQNDPAANALASRLVNRLRLLAPQASLPEIPPAKAGRAAPPGAAGSPQAAAARKGAGQPLPGRITGAVRGIGSSKRGSQLLVAGGALALLIVVGILAVAGVFGGGDDGGSSSSTTASDTTAADTGTNASNNGDLTIIRLSPLDGASGATGQAVLAQAEDQPVLQINLSGLPPSGDEQTYIVWLYSSDAAAFPLARDQVTENGNLTGSAAIPTEILPLLSQFGCVDVSLASNKETQQALQQAVTGQSLPRLTGDSVLRGQIPSGPGESAPTGPDSQCEVAAPPAGAGGAQGGGAQGGQ